MTDPTTSRPMPDAGSTTDPATASRRSGGSRRGLLTGAAGGVAGMLAMTAARPAHADPGGNPNSSASKGYVQEHFVRRVADLDELRGVADPDDGMAAEVVTTGRAGLFRFDASDLSAEVAQDPQSGILVAPGDTDGSAGAWVRTTPGPIKEEWFGAVGDGSTDDTAALVATYAHHGRSGRRWHVSAAVYSFAPTAVGNNIGGKPIHYLFEPHDDTDITADQGATLRLADGFSTDADPRQVSIFFGKGRTTNFSVDGLSFDLNGANNPMSPERDAGKYNKFKHATFWWEDDDAGCEGFSYRNGRIENSNGLNCIVAGRSNTEGSTMYHGFTVENVVFRNNGGDCGDHTTIYAWVNGARIHRCEFINPVPVPSWPSAYELHGSDSSFSMCRIEGSYQRGGYLSGNYTSTARGQFVHDNHISVESGGSNLFTNPRMKPVESIRFHHNDVTMGTAPVSNPSNWRFGFLCDSQRGAGVTDVTVESNTFRYLDPDSDNIGVRIGGGTADRPMDAVSVRNNTIHGAVTGVRMATTAGKDYVDRVDISHNQFCDLRGADSTGIQVSGNATHPPALVTIVDNTFSDDRDEPEFRTGVLLSNVIGAATVDGNTYDGLVGDTVTRQNLTVERYRGRELRIGAAAPTDGTWDAGDMVHNIAPGPGAPVGWVCTDSGSPGTWHPFGTIEG